MLDYQYPVVCGGAYVGGGSHTGKKCYLINDTEPFYTMVHPRHAAGAVVLMRDPQIIWVTGGDSRYFGNHLSTDYVSLNAEKAGPGPNLPEVM